MKPSLMMSGTIAIGRTVSLAPSAENIGEVYAATNDLVIGYRNVTTKPNYCRGSNGLCLEKNGRIFMRIGNPYGRPYVAGQERTAPTQIFTPTQGGRYEICAFADNKDEVNEGTSGELNNETCRVFSVTDVPVDLPTITGPVSLTADPTVVRRGNTSALTWNTGGRLTCVISGTNGQQIPVTTVTGVVPTAAINSQTVYTLRCSDEGYEGSDDAAIRILPTIQEI
jgi:hypothetical protein